MKKYQVIGGQYFFCDYGETDSLDRAKRIAKANEEYWDNWQGWIRPQIYLTAECHKHPTLDTMIPDGDPILMWNGYRWIEK